MTECTGCTCQKCNAQTLRLARIEAKQDEILRILSLGSSQQISCYNNLDEFLKFDAQLGQSSYVTKVLSILEKPGLPTTVRLADFLGDDLFLLYNYGGGHGLRAFTDTNLYKSIFQGELSANSYIVATSCIFLIFQPCTRTLIC